MYASNHVLWLYRLVGVRPGRKPRKTGFLVTWLTFYYFQNEWENIVLCYYLFIYIARIQTLNIYLYKSLLFQFLNA